MEARKITIVSTRDQLQSVIMSTAETLGELKADMQEAGINYEGLSFFERTAKVELREDESVLPHDVPYRGTTTNELLFLLTNTENKIKSGVMTRSEVYAYIKEHHLQNAIEIICGKNYTICPTETLISFIENHKAEAQLQACQQAAEQPKEGYASQDAGTREAIKMLVDTLCNRGYLTYDEQEEILDCLNDTDASDSECESRGGSSFTKQGESPYSDEEIQEMLRGF